MQIQFVVGDEIKYSTKLNMSRQDLFKGVYPNNNDKKFKIPINKNPVLNNIKNQKAFLQYDDESESSYSSSDSFVSLDEEEDDEDKLDSIKSDDMESNKKHLRKYKNELIYDIYSLSSTTKKQKKELTEDDILKRNDQMLKRKLHAKKMLEEEKRQTIEKILNEDGRKLRERQKKLNEEAMKKEQIQEENYKLSLTKVKLKHSRDGKIYLRFPQGLLLPKVLVQKNMVNKISQKPQKCQVFNCNNYKKYRDPTTKIYYCSVSCFKALKNSMHVN